MQRKIKIPFLPKIVDIWSHHRTGWPYCQRFFQLLNHRNSPVYFLDYADQITLPEFEWLDSNWIGFLHGTPTNRLQHSDYPAKYANWNSSLQDLFSQPNWLKYQASCRGIFVLSTHVRPYIEEITAIKTKRLYYPIKITKNKFNYDFFLTNPNKKLLTIGYWMRDYQQVFDFKTKIYKKFISNCGTVDLFEIKPLLRLKTNFSVGILPFADNTEYDLLLQKNIIFLPLHDVSGNTTIMDCIARNTPVLTNKLPGSLEYLGPDYPLFYEDLKEAQEKAHDFELIKKTHDYLKNMNKDKFTIRYFIDELVNSEIYQQLPDPPSKITRTF